MSNWYRARGKWLVFFVFFASGVIQRNHLSFPLWHLYMKPLMGSPAWACHPLIVPAARDVLCAVDVLVVLKRCFHWESARSKLTFGFCTFTRFCNVSLLRWGHLCYTARLCTVSQCPVYWTLAGMLSPQLQASYTTIELNTTSLRYLHCGAHWLLWQCCLPIVWNLLWPAQGGCSLRLGLLHTNGYVSW